MKVVHVVGGDLSKGAHRGAYWLHKGLLEIGVDSTIVGRFPPSQGEPGVESLSVGVLNRTSEKITEIGDALLQRFYRNRCRSLFSTGFFGKSIHRHPMVKSADVINLHWFAKGPIGLRHVKGLGRPTVLTLRDMWPFTGGCHYSLDCERYQMGCGMCPQLGSQSAVDLSRLVTRQKRRWIRNDVRVVGISDWISSCARQSSALKDHPIRTIYNCIDTSLFFPVARPVARKRLGIRTDKSIILAGAGKLTNFYKGFELLLKAVNRLDPAKTIIVIFGDDRDVDRSRFRCEVRSLGYLSDPSMLRLAYSSADVFVAPSIQEAFGKTLVESMCCGTPVVCFDASGPADIVKHRSTGYKARAYCDQDLASGIQWILNHDMPGRLRKDARAAACARFDKRVIAEEYKSLYDEMLETK